jgi:hypothetical protein
MDVIVGSSNSEQDGSLIFNGTADITVKVTYQLT